MTSRVGVIVLGCDHIGDIVECLISLKSSTLLLGIAQTNWIMISKEFD